MTSNFNRHLTNLDFSIFKTYLARSLTDQLDNILGPKTIIIHPVLAGPLGLVTQVGNLKEHGVDKLFWLENGTLGNAATAQNIVWVCQPLVSAMKLIARQSITLCTSLTLLLFHHRDHPGPNHVLCHFQSRFSQCPFDHRTPIQSS